MCAESEREPTERFSDRVEHYVRHRPGYPPGLLELCCREMGLVASHVVADVGSGTGKLAEIFLRNGNLVHAIEPNREMREAAEDSLGEFSGFRSVAGAAEETGLVDAGVDLIVAAQAFHWFRLDEARREFARIGRPDAWTALVWNTRLQSSPLTRAYEDLLRRLSTDYVAVDHRKIANSSTMDRFFGRGGFRREVFPNPQPLDREAFEGRALSTSYVPMPGQANHDAVMDELRRIFDEHQRDGRIVLDQETEVFWGHLDSK
jgi:SAM-dependent methyltransferase